MAIVPQRAGHRALLGWLLFVLGTGSNIALRMAYDTRPVWAAVHVRWAPSVDDAGRQRLEQRYGLVSAALREGRTWNYSLVDLSRTNIEALVRDPAIEDTDQIDRQAFRALQTGRAPNMPPNPEIPLAYELLSLSALVGAIVMGIAWAETRTPDGVSWRSLRYTGTLIAVVAVGYAPVTRVMLRQGDFPVHIGLAVTLSQGELHFPHFLFHLLTAEGIMFGLTPNAAALGVMLGFQALAAWGVSWMARRAGAAPLVAMCLGIAAVCISPILPFQVAADAALYQTAYFLPNALHNPTVTAAKAFVPFLIEIAVMLAGAASVAWSWPGIAAIVVLAGLAKPHYVSCLLPVGAVACAWSGWRGRPVPWDRAASFAVASVAVILWTMWMTAGEGQVGRVTIAPFLALQAGSDYEVPVDALSVVARACSDLAFPIAVLLLWPDARRFPALLVAWATHAVALGQALLLAEAGSRVVDGNFLWSPQLGTFGVMAASAAWLGRSSVRWDWRVIAAWSLVMLHVAYGLWWIIARVAGG